MNYGMNANPLRRLPLAAFAALCLACAAARAAAPRGGQEPPAWAEAMRKVHAKFTGQKGTLAQFGDSITVTMAYWAPLAHGRKNLGREGEAAFRLVDGYMDKACWAGWKGAGYGNDGGKTILWAAENVDDWLKKLNPETALVMFGTNDMGGKLPAVPLDEYEKAYRLVVRKCLDNGTVVILSTAPPRSGRLDQSKQFAEVVRKIAKDENVPLVDYFQGILARRPKDWDGNTDAFKQASGGDVYNVDTLISGDGVHPSNPRRYAGDYSEEALKHSGYGLRSYLTLIAYAEVIEKVLKAQ